LEFATDLSLKRENLLGREVARAAELTGFVEPEDKAGHRQ
jgi:hypothetical protein